LLNIVKRENLVLKLSEDLINKPGNILTLKSSPCLDLGDLPVAYLEK
jgi:hypothetical protein